MRRGEVWTVSGGAEYVGKPRPAVIVQSDRFSDTHSVTICLITTHDAEAPLLRVALEPSEGNGLRQHSKVMIDKVSTMGRVRLGQRIGRLSDEQMSEISQLLSEFLALA